MGQEDPLETWVRKSPQRLGSGRAPGDLGQEEPPETWVRKSPWRLGSGIAAGDLGQEEPLEKGMATHFSTVAWRIPQTEEPGGLQSMGSQRVGDD